MEPLVECELVGTDGNIFALLGVASRALNKAGFREEAKEMVNRATKSGSYSEALGVILEYVDA